MVKRLLLLNGVAVIGAIMFHATGWAFTAMFFWTDQYLPVSVPNFSQMYSANYYAIRVLEQILIYCVPAFLFVSGYFIAFATGKANRTIAWKVIFNRIRTLIIPFLLWSLIAIVLRIINGERFSPSDFLLVIVTGRASVAYYYVPVLISLYLISPFLVPLARARWWLLLLITATVQIAVMLLVYLVILKIDNPVYSPFYFLTRSWLFPGYIFWFSFGIVVGFHLEGFKQFLARTRWWLLAGFLLSFIAGLIEWEWLLVKSGADWIGTRQTLVDNFYIMGFLLCYLAFEKVNPPFKKQVNQIGAKSYGIYLVHIAVLEITSRLIYHVFPALLGYPLIFLLIITAMALAVPLGLMALVDHSPARPLYGYIFG